MAGLAELRLQLGETHQLVDQRLVGPSTHCRVPLRKLTSDLDS